MLRFALQELGLEDHKSGSDGEGCVPARPETGPGHDDPAEVRDAMAEALAARSMPGYQPRGNGRHAEFMGWRPSDIRRCCRCWRMARSRPAQCP